MNLENYNYATDEVAEESNLKDIISNYLAHWKWFLLSVALCLVAGFIYLKYTVPQYEVSAKILIKDDKKGGALSELSAFEDLGIVKGNSSIDNEIEILKSRTLMEGVVRQLRLNITCFSDEYPVDREQFDNSTVTLHILSGDSTLNKVNEAFKLHVLSDTEFELIHKNGKTQGIYAFNKEVVTEFGKIVITLNNSYATIAGSKTFKIQITPMDMVLANYMNKIQINAVNKTSNVIAISLKDPVKEKAIAIINTLIKLHNTDAIEDKNQVSKNTAEFINERIRFITGELSDVESSVEDFKTKHKLVDVVSEAGLFLNSGSLTEQKILETYTQTQVADYMLDYLKEHPGTTDAVPVNLGVEDGSVSGLINNYNTLVLERNRIFKNSSDKNPVVQNIDGQILNLRKSLQESLQNYKESLRIKLTELNRQESVINSKIATVPKYEREYRVIQRQQQIKETLYLYLLQKREETNIALAVTVANAKIIDNAYSNGVPVSPKKQLVYLLSFLCGILLPVAVIYVMQLLDNKVHGKKDIDKVKLPFLGDIPLSDSKTKIVVSKGDNSGIAEAFRLLRTNVDFMLGATKTNGKTIFVTSTIGKEGKSFVALNLASSLAISGKKVILVGMDLRAPKILKYLNLGDKKGLTDFIMSNDTDVSNYIFRTPELESLDILPSGSIPPNPAELLMNPSIKDLFHSLKDLYDYIVVDTAPVGMVTDTLLLSAYADAFVFVVRANYLDKRLLSIAENIYKEKRLPNMAILINGSDHTKGYGYGYGYGGYGYGASAAPKWWKRNRA